MRDHHDHTRFRHSNDLNYEIGKSITDQSRSISHRARIILRAKNWTRESRSPVPPPQLVNQVPFPLDLADGLRSSFIIRQTDKPPPLRALRRALWRMLTLSCLLHITFYIFNIDLK